MARESARNFQRDRRLAEELRQDGRPYTAAYIEKYGKARLPWTRGGPEATEESCRLRLERDAPMPAVGELEEGAVL